MILERTLPGGYVEAKKTRQGFEKMRVKGAILPPFAIQDNVTRILNIYFDRLIGEFDKLVTSLAAHNGLVTDSIPKEYAQIIRHLETMAIVTKDESLRESLDNQLMKAQQYFFKDFFEDASERIAIKVQFALDSDQVFKQNLDGIKKYYLDTAMERINEGESWLRQGFIFEFEKFINGESDGKDLPELIAKIKNESGKFSQFFARDQFSRFNKSLTLASFDAAGVTKMRWWAVNDARTRPKHHLLHNHVFDMNNLPTKWKAKDGTIINVEAENGAYLCRCCWLPVAD
jgi:hypothetical protein